MLIMGPSQCAPVGMDNFKVYNFTSLSEYVIGLNLIPPIVSRGEGFVYDVYYANWLMSDPNAFRNLITILYDIYSGYDVYLCIASMEIMGDINESFAKFVQQRYGLNCSIINCKDDLEYVSECQFSIEGIANFDIDKERAASAVANSVMNHQGVAGYDFILGDSDGSNDPLAKG